MTTYNITVTPSTQSDGWTFSGDSTNGDIGSTTNPIDGASTINFTLASASVSDGWSWYPGSSSVNPGNGNSAFFVSPNSNSNFTWPDPGSSATLAVTDNDKDPSQSGQSTATHSYNLYANQTANGVTTKYECDPQIINKRGG
jgi:hypothetical protein